MDLVEQIKSIKDFLYAVKHGLKFTGHVKCDHFRDGKLLQGGWESKPNTFTTEGMNKLGNIVFGSQSKAASPIWYVGIFKNNITPLIGDTAATKLGATGSYAECQDSDYDDPITNKPSYTIDVNTATAIFTDTLVKASFTIAAAITVYGAFLSSEQAKTSSSGILLCAKKFDTARTVIDNDILNVEYKITMTTN